MRSFYSGLRKKALSYYLTSYKVHTNGSVSSIVDDSVIILSLFWFLLYDNKATFGMDSVSFDELLCSHREEKGEPVLYGHCG